MLTSIQPTSSILNKYIEVFYVFDGNQPKTFSYIAFPHVNSSISIFKGVQIQRGNFEVSIQSNTDTAHPYNIEILGKYVQPVFVHYNGDFEEIAIVFKPFGINQFLRGNLIRHAPNFSQAFTNKEWLSFAAILFKEKSLSARISLLENFLLSIMEETENKMIAQALELLADTTQDINIESIAQQLSISVKTFQRHFYQQITCTPSAYKRIARFRAALQNKTLTHEAKSLTELTYESNYYDQSYFIREFKKLTRLNPKKFFETITVLDKKKIIWEIK